MLTDSWTMGLVPGMTGAAVDLPITSPKAAIARSNARLDQLARLRSQPQWIGAGITALASVFSHMFVDQHRALEAIRRLPAPALLVWGDQDPLIDRTVIDHVLGLRPDWRLHVIETVGHLPPMEVPDAYAAVVGDWLTAMSGR